MSPDLPPASSPAPASWVRRLRASRAGRIARDILVLVAVVVGVGLWQTRDHVRGAAPDFSLEVRGGRFAGLADLRGRPAMIVFWAPWCTVCRMASPNVSRVARWTSNRAHVVSIATGFDDRGEVDRYVDDVDATYPVLLDDGRVARAFDVRAFPTTYFLDENGEVTGSVVGYTTTLGLLVRLLL